MTVRGRILLVTPTTPLAKTLSHCARLAGYEVTVVTTFQAARTHIVHRPDLLITELKLGEHNGLQLALRLASTGVPAIVVADKTFEHEVEQLGAVWLAADPSAADELPAVMSRLLQGSGSTHDVYPWYDDGETEAAPAMAPVGLSPRAPRLH